MKQSSVSFKFKNEKKYDTIKFFGSQISLKELKNQIKDKLQQSKAAPGEYIFWKRDKGILDFQFLNKSLSCLMAMEPRHHDEEKWILIQKIIGTFWSNKTEIIFGKMKFILALAASSPPRMPVHWKGFRIVDTIFDFYGYSMKNEENKKEKIHIFRWCKPKNICAYNLHITTLYSLVFLWPSLIDSC